ncbi:3418_t:CDS:2, partial [Racocetra persica]
CMEAVERDFALQDESLKITNTLRYCANHLKDCSYFAAKHSPEQIQNIINLATSSTSNKHLLMKICLPQKDKQVLSQYIGHPLNASEVFKFERLVLQATISAENPEVKELFHFISPYLKLPNQRSLSNCILMNATNKVQTTIKELVCKDKIGNMIAFDGWRNIVNEELMGVVFITSSGKTLIWAARHCLKREMQDKVFIPCFAHQANCCVGDIFKESVIFKNTSKRALRIVAFFYCSVYFTAKLHDEQKNTLVTKDDVASDDDLKLLADIKAAINCDSFWDSLVILCNMLRPFCGALDLMQRDKAHFHNLSYYYKVWFDNNPNCLLRELELYNQQKYPFIEKTFNHFKGDIILWWSYNSGAAPELSHIACQLYGIYITTALVERLFSTMGFLHSPLRNKLKPEKVIAMSQLRAEILRARKKKSNSFHIQSNYLSTSLSSVDSISFASLASEENIADDTNDGANEDISSEADWDEKLLINEEFEEEQDDFDAEIDFLDLETHPAKNQAVK